MNEQTTKMQTDKEREKYEEELVSEVQADFERRREERLPLERQWELNMNFLSGNQYCGFNSVGDLTDENKTFFWQNRGVYNHIAPIIESRLARFARVKPQVSVRPRTDDDKDVNAAVVAEKLIEMSFKNSDIEDVSKKVNTWAETCGTGFYKVVWDNKGGEIIGEVDGELVYEGETKILPVSPFEIFPDNLNNENIKDCNSIIHAKAMTVKDVYEKYGVLVNGTEVGVFNLATNSASIKNYKNGEKLKDAVVVIERYEKPCSSFPEGRLITIAGGKLLYLGSLPYVTLDTLTAAQQITHDQDIPIYLDHYYETIVYMYTQRAFS